MEARWEGLAASNQKAARGLGTRTRSTTQRQQDGDSGKGRTVCGRSRLVLKRSEVVLSESCATVLECCAGSLSSRKPGSFGPGQVVTGSQVLLQTSTFKLSRLLWCEVQCEAFQSLKSLQYVRTRRSNSLNILMTRFRQTEKISTSSGLSEIIHVTSSQLFSNFWKFPDRVFAEGFSQAKPELSCSRALLPNVKEPPAWNFSFLSD